MRNVFAICLVVGLGLGLSACRQPAEPEAGAAPDPQTGTVERTTPEEQTGTVERTTPDEQ